eukprot:TRINITY_DN54905_c0_g3_i1.p2 TRINITY_DN54905_c0_g3~~TRINITY_DN54905_c0_g3_i1.p2  ORF type:complete len:288 (-),score=9.97 TRINITY_DN54905_c0_g3_i1:536-1399(-)
MFRFCVLLFFQEGYLHQDSTSWQSWEVMLRLTLTSHMSVTPQTRIRFVARRLLLLVSWCTTRSEHTISCRYLVSYVSPTSVPCAWLLSPAQRLQRGILSYRYVARDVKLEAVLAFSNPLNVYQLVLNAEKSSRRCLNITCMCQNTSSVKAGVYLNTRSSYSKFIMHSWATFTTGASEVDEGRADQSRRSVRGRDNNTDPAVLSGTNDSNSNLLRLTLMAIRLGLGNSDSIRSAEACLYMTWIVPKTTSWGIQLRTAGTAYYEKTKGRTTHEEVAASRWHWGDCSSDC